MSFLSPPQPGTSSEARDLFFALLTAVLQSGGGFRSCPSLSDPTWIYAGVERVVSSVKSGREFLQNFFPWIREGLALGPYFKVLRRARRTTKVGEVAALVRARADQKLPNGLEAFAELKDFAVYAGDGHYLAHATHDPKTEETHWPTGFFFAMDLKTQTLRLLALADAKGRKKEHDLRALKRLEREQLRQAAPVGTKVLWVWDKAGIDLPFWKQAKQAGVYFLCLKKENQCLELARERELDQEQKINQGVAWDRLVVDRRGITLREIGFNDPLRAQPYVYLTSEFTLEPGLLVLLYTRRSGGLRKCLMRPRTSSTNARRGLPR